MLTWRLEMITPAKRMGGSTMFGSLVEALRRGARSSDRQSHFRRVRATAKRGKLEKDDGAPEAPADQASARKDTGNILDTYA